MTNVEAGRSAGRPVSRELLVPVDRLLLALLAGMFVLAGAVLSAGAVAFNALSGQILGLQEQMGGIHEEIGHVRAEMHEEIGGLRTEMRGEIGKLSDRMAQLSDRMGQLSDRMTRVETLIETHLVPASNVRDPAGP